MSKTISLLLALFICVCVLSGCGAQKETSTRETVAVVTQSETEPETEPLTEAPSESNALYAIDLIKMSVSEIVELIGGDFELEYAGDHLVWYTSGGLCFYNEDTLPGYAFFLDDYGDVDLYANGSMPEDHFDEVKDNILSGKCGSISFMGVYDGGAYDERISVGMSYVDISEILGSYELGPLVADASIKQPIQYKDMSELPAGTIYYPYIENMQISDKDGFQYPDTRWVRSENPISEKMVVFPNEI